ncbi:MAG: TonB-dependent receptor [Deltaproteobacteria bacterium]|nr:TonB-dependent receptor [Deltaproteobacteria bacterium]
MRKPSVAFLAGVLGLAAWLGASVVHAQSATTGAIQGTVTDDSTGQKLAGVTVVVTSPSLQGTQEEVSDSTGQYYIANLPPGTYEVTFYYSEITVRRQNIGVSIGKVTPVHVHLETSRAAGEVITIVEKAPSIDIGSTKQGVTIDQEYTKNIPVSGRTFADVLGAAAGSSGDFRGGTTFSGSTSLENSYVIDGLNTTSLTYGEVGTGLLTNFIQEIEVITGGYDAEFGRSTGGVANVITKTGSNEFHGSAWANVKPVALSAKKQFIKEAGSAINKEYFAAYDMDFGFDLGGPIIKDKLWFYVGYAPIFQKDTAVRKVSMMVDRENNDNDYSANPDPDSNPATNRKVGCELAGTCESDGRPDVIDPITGEAKFEEIDRKDLDYTRIGHQIMSKINFAVNPQNQGNIGLFLHPESGNMPPPTMGVEVSGTRAATITDYKDFTSDLTAKWTSKALENKLQFDFTLGWHRFKTDEEPYLDKVALPGNTSASNNDTPRINAFNRGDYLTLGNVGRYGNEESATVLQFCTDREDDPTIADPFPGIQNCPVTSYRLGGRGFLEDNIENRYVAGAVITNRQKLAGHHEFKFGGDLELNSLESVRMYTGGKYTEVDAATGKLYSFVTPTDQGTGICAYVDEDGDGVRETPVKCNFLDELSAAGATINYAAFVQDKWQILPNLTVKAGLRWEQQVVKNSDIVEEATGKEDAMNLKNLISPRVGVLYDWTKEGRSRIYANYGRFYESVPMDINNRAFGGESQNVVTYGWDKKQCGGPVMDDSGKISVLPGNPASCPAELPAGKGATNFGGSGTEVAPGIGSQFLDEVVLGLEYEVLADLNLGVSYQNRRLGRVIEDVSPDGAHTYLIANPGEFDEGEEAALESKLAAATDPKEQASLRNRLILLRGLREFDKPSRIYNAIQFTAKKRFSENFFVQASYTYSRTKGNYEGLLNSDNRQVDPNISSAYDLVELLPNRAGDLAQDRPHLFKLDGYYRFDLKEAGLVTLGTRLRAQSGRPLTYLGTHPLYGAEESYILPRGLAGRTPMHTSADLHLAYGRGLSKDMKLEVFMDLFNLFNRQTASSQDQEYTQDSVAPVVGGTIDDLKYLKRLDDETMSESGGTARKLANFSNPTQRFAPFGARLGLALTF